MRSGIRAGRAVLEGGVLLQELDIECARGLVVEPEIEAVTLAGPRLVRLPDVNVLVGGRVVCQAALARGDRFLDRVKRAGASRACGFGGRRRPGLEYVHSLSATEAEFHGYRASGLDRIPHAGIVDRLIEAGEAIGPQRRDPVIGVLKGVSRERARGGVVAENHVAIACDGLR